MGLKRSQITVFHALVAGNAIPHDFNSITELETFAKSNDVISVRYTSTIVAPGGLFVYTFKRVRGTLVANGRKEGWGDEKIEVPVALIKLIDPLEFTIPAPFGILIENTRTGFSIRAFGVVDPIIAVKIIIAAIV